MIRFLSERWQIGLGVLGAVLLMSSLYGVTDGFEALVVLATGLIVGVIGGLAVLGFALAFNPLCQDLCMVIISSLFAATGALAAVYHLVIGVGGVVGTTDSMLGVGLAIGVSAVALMFARGAAGRLWQRGTSGAARS